MKQKIKKRKDKVKVRKTKAGKRYITLGRRKYYLKPKNGVSERELIRWIIKRYTRRRRSRRTALRGAIKPGLPGHATVSQSIIDKAVNDAKGDLARFNRDELLLKGPAAIAGPGVALALPAPGERFVEFRGKRIPYDAAEMIAEEFMKAERAHKERAEKEREEAREREERAEKAADEANRRAEELREREEERAEQERVLKQQEAIRKREEEIRKAVQAHYSSATKKGPITLNREKLKTDGKKYFGSLWNNTRREKIFNQAYNDPESEVYKTRKQKERELRGASPIRRVAPLSATLTPLPELLRPKRSVSASAASSATYVPPPAHATPRRRGTLEIIKQMTPESRSRDAVRSYRREASPPAGRPSEAVQDAIRDLDDTGSVPRFYAAGTPVTEHSPKDLSDEDQQGSGAKPHEQSELDNEVERQLSGSGDTKKRILSDMLYSDQIDNVMSIYPDYLGTIAHDEVKSRILPKIKPKSRGGVIINTDPKSKGGKHWTALFWDARERGPHFMAYYDSFGHEPSVSLAGDFKAISDKLQPSRPLKLKINKIKQQRSNSFTCGWMTIRFISQMMNGKRFKEVTQFDDSTNGEKSAKQLKKKWNLFGYI